MLSNFMYSSALAGGVLIGVSAFILLLSVGRIAGMSGVTASIISKNNGDGERYLTSNTWRLVFIIGLVAGAGLFHLLSDQVVPFRQPPSTLVIIIAGLLVGFGSHLGSGCTSGHGVCGIGRLSTRSIVATCTFMFSAGVTVFIVRHIIG